MMSDSCGYIALDHVGKRVIVAFRGTYSITNTIYDLATVPQEYVPYPGDPDDDPEELPASHGFLSKPWRWFRKAKHRFASWTSGVDDDACANGKSLVGEYGHKDVIEDRPEGPKCSNCTVHMGFFESWKDCRRLIIPHLEHLHDFYPSYNLHLVGHSLGGAVAALAALETEVLGWHPTVTTFGEPRIGNAGLRDYLNEMFELYESDNLDGNGGRYRRMTHTNDPVPLLPLTEWGYKMHSGEIYISKAELQPSASDLRLCDGDEDTNCIFGGEAEAPFVGAPEPEPDNGAEELEINRRWGFPARYRIWQLFFAHRDYFWRLGLCVKGGDPADWGRRYDYLTGDEL
jgi:pimeloyl-ACP methyl ester carboxylesterase